MCGGGWKRRIADLIFGPNGCRIGSFGRLIPRMKASSFGILGAILLIGCGQRDPIANDVKQCSADSRFRSGIYSPIYLPATATPKEVLDKVLPNASILETREVHISYGNQQEIAPESTVYTAVLVDAGMGRKVVLLHFDQDRSQPPGGTVAPLQSQQDKNVPLGSWSWLNRAHVYPYDPPGSWWSRAYDCR
jgi:hypothetical protein